MLCTQLALHTARFAHGALCTQLALHTARFAHGALCTRHALHAALTGADEELVGDPGVIDVVDGGSEEGGQNLQV